ncbi:MAG TPA: PilT/PilU family type 4a pilus ATPase [Phycisphaerae bacterium]|nr:PilT/PilU family type 4a pilus ATPase [Phycisphaerae bacterium]
MSSDDPMEKKIYALGSGQARSLRDLLDYFATRGTMRVSDLHLKVGVPPVYRVDGLLRPIEGPPLDAPTAEALVSSFLTELEIGKLREVGSVETSCMTDKLQFRVNCFRDNDGFAAAVRALENRIPAVEKIGFPNAVWRDILDMQQGLVLLTGITGAGKSTTIASLIDRIARDSACRIITLEDPIEYRLRSQKGVVSQREVGRNVRSFEAGLRDCLREDPDVIFVGEMRDQESTMWTLTAAETGHLVFSTLHTRDARGSITRVLDMFPPSRQDEIASQLSLGLRYVISQKLLPRRDGQGRVVAMEILNNTYAVANLIRLGKLEQLYTFLQTRTRDVPEERMVTMERSLATLVRQGIVSPLEAEKWANDRAAFLDEMKNVPNE